MEQDLVLLIAVREGIHVGVVDQRVVSISPWELLRVRKMDIRKVRIAADCQSKSETLQDKDMFLV